MEKLFESSVVKGLIFSTQDQYGPHPTYIFPEVSSEEESKELKKQNIIKITEVNCMHISIKSLSFLMSDQKVYEYEEYEEEFIRNHGIPYYGIIPFPDIFATALTFYHFIKVDFSEKPLVAAFSILVDENQRSFLYNNIERFRSIMFSFFNKFDKVIYDGYKPKSEVEPLFKEFLLKIIEIEKKPFAPITSKRKLKILMCGLDDAGKSSFLLAVDRKYSKLIGLKPTMGADVRSIETLGSTIFLWDLGGQVGSREKYINKAHIYLYEADLLFFFIDINNKDRFEESIEYLQTLKLNLNQFKQSPPIIYIFSKGDTDVINSVEIKKNIEYLRSRLLEINPEKDPEIYITSIFSIFTILRAFSSGLVHLSPNKELINLNLKKFCNRAEVYLSLLLNNEGLVLADFYSNNANTLINIPKSSDSNNDSDLRHIFEVTAPQFAILYKIFAKFKALQQEEAIFKITNSLVLLKKVQIANYEMFMLFLIDQEQKKKLINELLPDFLYRTSDLLLRYIS